MVLTVLIVFSVYCQVLYSQTYDVEVRDHAALIPCNNTLLIVHETMFTYAPFDVLIEDRCHVVPSMIVLTDLTRRQAHSAGLDVVDESHKQYLEERNATVPDSFIYVNSVNFLNVSVDEECVIHEGRGGNVTFVAGYHTHKKLLNRFCQGFSVGIPPDFKTSVIQ
jgi:hypothetical protein